MLTENRELVGVRDASRSLPRLIDDIQDGVRDKYVLTRHGKMIAVLLTVDDYEELLRRGA